MQINFRIIWDQKVNNFLLNNQHFLFKVFYKKYTSLTLREQTIGLNFKHQHIIMMSS